MSILPGMFSSAFYTFKQDLLLKFVRHLHLNETLWAAVAPTEPPRCQNRFRGFYFVAHFRRRPEAANKNFWCTPDPVNFQSRAAPAILEPINHCPQFCHHHRGAFVLLGGSTSALAFAAPCRLGGKRRCSFSSWC